MAVTREQLLERLFELCVDPTGACRKEKHEAADLYQQIWPKASINQVAKASGLSHATIERKRALANHKPPSFEGMQKLQPTTVTQPKQVLKPAASPAAPEYIKRHPCSTKEENIADDIFLMAEMAIRIENIPYTEITLTPEITHVAQQVIKAWSNLLRSQVGPNAPNHLSPSRAD